MEFTNPSISRLERYIRTYDWGLVSNLTEITYFC